MKLWKVKFSGKFCLKNSDLGLKFSENSKEQKTFGLKFNLNLTNLVKVISGTLQKFFNSRLSSKKYKNLLRIHQNLQKYKKYQAPPFNIGETSTSE